MTPSQAHAPPSRFDRLLLWTLAALLLFTPLAFGTVEVWSIAVAELLVLCMGVIWIARMIRDGRLQFEPTPFNAPILLFLALMLFQILPLPLAAIRHLSPAAYSVYSDAASVLHLQMGWRTISVDPVATREELLRTLTYALLFWIMLNNFRDRKQIERIVVIIIGMGLFLAVFGIAQHFSGSGKIYGVRELTQGGSPFGPYVNRNHFAGYMEIAIPLTVGYLLAQSPFRKEPLTRKERFLQWTSQHTSQSVLLLFAAAFMGASLLLSGSRGGLVSFVGSMVFFVVMAAMKRPSRSKGARLALGFCGLVLIAAVWIGGNSAFLSLERLEQGIQEPSREERLILWQDTIRVASDYLRFGSGFNTFEEVFPAYKTSTMQAIFQYAHNDYLQLLAEGGIVAFGLAVWFIVAWYREVTVRWLRRHDPLAAYLALAGMTAMFAMLIHSLTDFNLHIPANAILTVAVLATAHNAARLTASGQSVNRQSEHCPERGDAHGRAAGAWGIGRTVIGMSEHRIDAIITRLAQPEPLPDLSPLCPEKRELTRILLELARGVRSQYYPDLCEVAEREHLEVRRLVQKAKLLLASLHISSPPDYYSILEVDRNASAEEIRERWIEKMRLYHPDKYEDPSGWIAQQSACLNEAFAVLKDPERRRQYDARLRAQSRGSHQSPGSRDPVLAARPPSWLPVAVVIVAITIAGLIVGVLLWPW